MSFSRVVAVVSSSVKVNMYQMWASCDERAFITVEPFFVYSPLHFLSDLTHRNRPVSQHELVCAPGRCLGWFLGLFLARVVCLTDSLSKYALAALHKPSGCHPGLLRLFLFPVIASPQLGGRLRYVVLAEANEAAEYSGQSAPSVPPPTFTLLYIVYCSKCLTCSVIFPTLLSVFNNFCLKSSHSLTPGLFSHQTSPLLAFTSISFFSLHDTEMKESSLTAAYFYLPSSTSFTSLTHSTVIIYNINRNATQLPWSYWDKTKAIFMLQTSGLLCHTCSSLSTFVCVIQEVRGNWLKTFRGNLMASFISREEGNVNLCDYQTVVILIT